MYEFGVENFQSVQDFQGEKKAIGSKPLVVFLGDQWQIDSLYGKVQNLLLDLFRGFKADKINLQGVDHVITCAVQDGVIAVRAYYVKYRKADNHVPDLVLQPMGPFFDLHMRRTQTAQDDLWKVACKKPKMWVLFPHHHSPFFIGDWTTC